MYHLLFYSNYDEFKFLYVGGSHASTLECLFDRLLGIMFLFCRNEMIVILILIGDKKKEKSVWCVKTSRVIVYSINIHYVTLYLYVGLLCVYVLLCCSFLIFN